MRALDGGPLATADRLIGSAIEQLTAAHHERRLRRLGHDASRHPPAAGLWAAGDPPPRTGNAVEILIDGAAYLAAVTDAIAGARHSVQIAGWCISPDFAMVRGEQPVVLRDLLADAAERVDVRVLLWAGAPVPAFPLRRAHVRAARDELTRDTRIRVALDANERPLHCHHEKLVIIDGELAFVGGIDLTDMGGDRYDTPEHPARGRLGWHDAASRLRGPVVADVARHFAARWQAVTGEACLVSPAPATAGDVEVQLVRTVPEHLYDFAPRGDFRILEAYLRALHGAQRLVYLENQFLWAPEVVDVLAQQLREPPADDFRVVLLLPSHANNGEDDTLGQLGLLADADAGRGRLLATTLRARTGSRVDPLYVHAKVAIVDDHWLTVGSANLNAHSFYNDTEVNIVTCDRALARDTRLRLWASHLECGAAEVEGDHATVVDQLWRPIAAEQLARDERGDPATHGLVQLRPGSRRAMRLLGPLQSLVVDG